MFRKSSILNLALLCGVTACQAHDPVAPATTTTADGTATLEVAAPESSGSTVTSDDVLFLFAHFDAARDLMSVHGLYVQFCQGDPPTRTARTIVTTPSPLAQRLVKIGEEQQPVVVYRTTTGALTCELINSPEARVASGFVRHSQVFTLASFTATWRGAVISPDGSSHPYTETYQLTADIHDPNNPDLWSLNSSEILIH